MLVTPPSVPTTSKRTVTMDDALWKKLDLYAGALASENQQKVTHDVAISLLVEWAMRKDKDFIKRLKDESPDHRHNAPVDQQGT